MKVTFNEDFKFDLQLFAEDGDDTPQQDLDDEDIKALIDEDPDLALDPDLEDEDDDEDDDIDLDDEKPKKKAVRRSEPRASAIDEETQRVLDDIKANPDKYRRQEVAPGPVLQKEQSKEEPQLDLARAVEEFSTDLLSDPKKAAAKLLMTVYNMNQGAESRIRKQVEDEFRPIATQSATQAVNSAMRSFDSHPAMTPEVKKVFREIVGEASKNYGAAIAKMPQAEIEKGMESALAEAIGRVAMQGGKTRPRQSTPSPTYTPRSGGGSRPSGRSAPTLSADERDVVRNMRAAGIDAKSIKQAIREIREEAS